MLKKSQLSKLSPTELLLLDKHLKLGKSHLENFLTQKELEDVFALGSIPKAVEKKLKVSKLEKVGVSTLSINTILTGALGSWLGISGYLHLRLDSLPLFITILTFSTLIGGFIGFISSRLREKFSQKATDRRKLQDLEITILNKIIEKRSNEFKEKKEELIATLARIGIHEKIAELENLEHLNNLLLRWIEKIQTIVREKYEKNENTNSLNELLESEKRGFTYVFHKEEAQDKETEEFNNILNKLSKSSIQPPVVKKSWLRTNLLNIISGLMPTVFGGFGSLFVYVGGAPTIAKEMGKESLFQFFTRPEIAITQFIMVFLITIYFALIFIYLTFKDYKRDGELSKIDIYITHEENELDLLDDKLLKLKKALDLIKKFEYALHFFKKHLAKKETA